MKEFEKKELHELMIEREAMYQFLARVYREEVDPELLPQICQMDFPVDTGVPEIDRGFQMLLHYLQAVKDTTLTDLASDYARIFFGVGPTQTGGAFPYESVYTSPRGLLMQEARDRVVAVYRKEGMERSAEICDPEDHLSFELEFVAHLCQKTLKAIETQDEEATASYLQKQQEFLEKHLLPWVPGFCADVERIAPSDFYRAVALITSGYLTIDHDLISDLLPVPEGFEPSTC